jgi:cytosine/adenosine deaminase-related metal-dependent hydrolase
MGWPADSAGRSGTEVNTIFINAQLRRGRLGSLCVRGSQIAAVDAQPNHTDLVVDLKGDRLLPGLINAHDHLQLNNLPAHEAQSPHFYRHARDWVSEVDSRRRTDPQFAAGVAVARDERLLGGAIKNLLSGVTTVAHHDPLYPFLTQPDFPIAVVRDYGWSHSLYIDGEQTVAECYRSTPSHWPWIVHAAEGLNEEAADEFNRLEALGCLNANTLLVHGIALDQSQRRRLNAAGAGLIACPSSNMRLFGKAAEVGELIAQNRVALGTDSRLSGARDLLDELTLAAELYDLDESTLEDLVTGTSADLLRLRDRGALRPGMRADLLVLPADTQLSSSTRANVRMLMIEGVVRYGDEDCVPRAAPSSEWASVMVDGVPKLLDARIARLLSGVRAAEAGLELGQPSRRVA